MVNSTQNLHCLLSKILEAECIIKVHWKHLNSKKQWYSSWGSRHQLSWGKAVENLKKKKKKKKKHRKVYLCNLSSHQYKGFKEFPIHTVCFCLRKIFEELTYVLSQWIHPFACGRDIRNLDFIHTKHYNLGRYIILSRL